MSTICITGGTGTIGTCLSLYLLAKGHRVIVLCRSCPESAIDNIQYVHWNPSKGEIDAKALKNTDCIVHLAGANVAEKRWTRRRKKEIVESRTLSSKTIVDFLQNHPNQVKTVISMSAIGWYGPDRGTVFTENDPPYDDFLGNTCKAWEESITPVTALGKRLVIFRTGIVLAKEGGALAEFVKPIRFGIAPILGSGKQMISWIHITDLCSMFDMAIEQEKISGIFNAVAPYPVSNKTLMLTLASVLKGKMFFTIPVPSFILKLMLGEMSIEVLKSATAGSEKIVKEGFQFQFNKINQAFTDIFKTSQSQGRIE